MPYIRSVGHSSKEINCRAEGTHGVWGGYIVGLTNKIEVTQKRKKNKFLAMLFLNCKKRKYGDSKRNHFKFEMIMKNDSQKEVETWMITHSDQIKKTDLL